MRNVRIGLELQYIECDLAPDFAEKAPQLRIYLDGHFQRKPIDVRLDEYDLNKVYSAQVSGKVSKRAGPLPKTAAIGIASFVQRQNEFGAPCLMDAGTTHITIGEILETVERDGHFQKQLPLIMHTTKTLGQPGATALEKGKIMVRIRKEDIHMDNVPLLTSRAPLSSPVAQVSQTMVDYIENTLKEENEMGNTIDGTQNVKAPFYYGEAGIEWQELEQESEAIDKNIAANIDYHIPAIPLPAAAYMRYEIPETNAAFWDNAFKTVMERDDMTVHDFEHLSLDEKAATMAKVNVFLVQYLDYVSDEVDRNNRHQRYQNRLKQGFENFGDPLVSILSFFLLSLSS